MPRATRSTRGRSARKSLRSESRRPGGPPEGRPPGATRGRSRLFEQREPGRPAHRPSLETQKIGPGMHAAARSIRGVPADVIHADGHWTFEDPTHDATLDRSEEHTS